ncbi:hypothetical protein B9Z19DRAFT_1133374 [Tuber borchii]|uniref:Uncharacterized protein n=1 Tax=Tuber borchii TaxID=42251 RepID=A0A2T6ZFY2_TUBBO|nr:hypothetical protein B9Z19DRAFT_1133374 [Tuber borchii]
MPNNLYTLNVSGSVAIQQLLEYIMSFSLRQTSIPPSSRGAKELVIAAIRKLKAMTLDPTRDSRVDGSVHSFLLTSQLDHGAIDLPPGGVHGADADSHSCHSEQMPITVEEIVSTLRTGVYLSEDQDVVIRLFRAGDSRIGEVIGEAEYPRLVLGEK